VLGLTLNRQLITTSLAVALILFAIHLLSLSKDLPRELLIVTRRVLGSVRVHLRPIDRDHPDLPYFRTR
jgi:hypothetical protein